MRDPNELPFYQYVPDLTGHKPDGWAPLADTSEEGRPQALLWLDPEPWDTYISHLSRRVFCDCVQDHERLAPNRKGTWVGFALVAIEELLSTYAVMQAFRKLAET